MRLAWIALAAALGAGAGRAADEQGQTSDPRAGEATGGDTKGYGYGEQPGREASDSARQAGDPERATAKAPQDQRAEPGAKAPALVGRVVEVGKGTIVIRRDDGKVERLRVTRDTRIVRDGKPVALSTLAPGTEVRAGLAGGKGRTATRIVVGAGEAAANAPLEEGKPRATQQPVKEKARGEKE